MPDAAQPNPRLAEELARLPLLEGEPAETIAWIASHMVEHEAKAGEVHTREGDPVRDFIIILEGEFHFQHSGFNDVLIAPAGHPTGILPFSRLKTWPGRGWAAVDTRWVTMDASHLRELVYRAPVLAQRLVAEMTDRTRNFTRLEESSNRLVALGKLSAGLAHELNNPASAAVRSSSRLRTVLNERRRQALAQRNETLPAQAVELLTDLSESIIECASSPGVMDALERDDLESELTDWLEGAGVSTDLASELAGTGLGLDPLRPLAGMLSAATLERSLRILVAEHEILCLSRELEEASRRISDLVRAVKTYSYMDQSPVAEVDVEQGIDVTLRMFQHLIKQGITVSRNFARNLPRIRANGSALNQVWTNLIDNALHVLGKMPKDGERVLSVRTCCEVKSIVVEIGDNGPGIPAELTSRIFDPFFTTKAVGEGTGLGLDIVQRIVRNHKGSIVVESKPGRTVFQVRLPVQAE